MILLEGIKEWQFGFQTPYTPVMEGIINFHHDLFYFLVCILFFVFYLLIRTIMLYNKDTNKTPYIIVHAPMLEIIWTIIPALILVLIAIPSFSLLYSIDEVIEPLFTIKVIGHQWYWTYEYLDPNVIFGLYYEGNPDADRVFLDVQTTFDSYLVADDDLVKMENRLLEVDNRLYLPTEVNIRVLVTSADVLHSWAVPALGVKLVGLSCYMVHSFCYQYA